MAAAVGGFAIVGAIADAAPGSANADRAPRLACRRRAKPRGARAVACGSWSAIRTTNAKGVSLPSPTKMVPTSPQAPRRSAFRIRLDAALNDCGLHCGRNRNGTAPFQGRRPSTEVPPTARSGSNSSTRKSRSARSRRSRLAQQSTPSCILLLSFLHSDFPHSPGRICSPRDLSILAEASNAPGDCSGETFHEGSPCRYHYRDAHRIKKKRISRQNLDQSSVKGQSRWRFLMPGLSRPRQARR